MIAPGRRCPSAAARDRGSIIALVFGFFLVALLVVAGSVAAGQAFVQQQGLQGVCDGAAAAAAASAADLDREPDLGAGHLLRFQDVQRVVGAYFARDPDRSDVAVDVQLSPDATVLRLRCSERMDIAFGAMFGHRDGVMHTVRSSARAPLT